MKERIYRELDLDNPGNKKLWAGVALHLGAEAITLIGGKLLGFDVNDKKYILFVYLPPQIPAFYLMGTGLLENARHTWSSERREIIRGALSTAARGFYYRFIRGDKETAMEIGREYFEGLE